MIPKMITIPMLSTVPAKPAVIVSIISTPPMNERPPKTSAVTRSAMNAFTLTTTQRTINTAIPIKNIRIGGISFLLFTESLAHQRLDSACFKNAQRLIAEFFTCEFTPGLLNPGRSSLQATYAQIVSDLNEAARLYQNFYAFADGREDRLYYITPDAITALQARVALQMNDYTTAINASTSLINSGTYPLTGDAETYRGIWELDNGEETIWQIYMSNPNELGTANGLYFHGQRIPNAPETQTPSFFPKQPVIDMYDQANDIRFTSFFTQFTYTASTGASGTIWLFDKYPGNPTMGTNSDNYYVNMSKPFRIAEQYLIAAEAYLESGDLSNATNYLNELRSHRITGYSNESFGNAETLRTAIRTERHKELIGEGFRFYDLKRWGMGMDRGNDSQNDDLTFGPGLITGRGLSIPAGDYRFTWPIPQAEMDTNPQLEGQQTPGY